MLQKPLISQSGPALLALLLFGGGSAFSEPVVVDVGVTNSFAASPAATSHAWSLDGVPVGGSNTFVYSPQIYDVGMHHLQVAQTFPGPVVSNLDWAVRVRPVLPAPAVNYYVATNGSDSNPGTLGQPFRTIDRARDVIRTLSRPLPAGGVTVWLRGGTYQRTNSFTLNNVNDSGTPTAPIVYRSHPGETAVISGGKAIPAAGFVALNSSRTNRVAPGVNPASIRELDVASAGILGAATFPAEFNSWTTFNIHNQGYDGGLCELIYNGKRQFLSRYPNHDLSNDDLLTTNMLMDGVAVGRLNPGTTLLWPGDSTNYLSYPGTYTNSAGAAVAVGGAFHCKPGDVDRFTRWQSALTNGGLWLQGYWRVPWQIDAVKIKGFDATNRAVLLETTASPGGGLGSKYARPVGYKTEPYWAINLLEEMDQPGEWAVDFSRNKIYFYPPGPITDGSVVISDLTVPLVQITGRSNIVFASLTFESGLAQGILITNGVRNLVLGSTFRNMGNVPVEISNGGTNGVVSCNLVDLAGGGVLLRGGVESTNPAARVPARNFVVNTLITNFSRVPRVYAAAVDSGFFGSGTGSGGGGHVASVGMRAANNRIATSPHSAVLHASWDSVFEYNDISEFQQVSDDLGAFYSYDYSYQHGNQTFRYNFIHDSPVGNGIDFDQDGYQMRIYGNVMNLNTDTGKTTQGYGVIYHDYNQDIPGREQPADCRNNLFANTRIGAVFVAPLPSVIEGNAAVSCITPFTWKQVIPGATSNVIVTSSQAVMESAPNTNYVSDPGFVDLASNDIRLKPDSRVYSDLPTFREIPVELIGLFNDEFRSNAPLLPPVVGNPDGATDVTTNSATLHGRLDFPWLTGGATVSVCWGTNDGGTNPLDWHNSATLGQSLRGTFATNVTGLVSDVVYYYRYQASNSAGVAWAPGSQSFLTAPPPPPSPVSLSAEPQYAQIALTWSEVAGATTYNVKRSTTNGGPYVTLTNVTGLVYTDADVVPGMTYYYVISALSGAMEGNNSVQVGAAALSGAVKADNIIALDQGPSWLSGSVPTSGVAIWDSTVTTNGVVTAGAGVSFHGVVIRDPNPDITLNSGGAGTIAIGGGGINLSTSTRKLTINSSVSLLTNQSWITGNSGPTNSVQLAVTGNIGGTGGILLSNTAGCALAIAGTNNTFAGGLRLGPGARVVVVGTTNAAGAGGVPSASYLGVGPLTIAGGAISNTAGFGLNQGIANSEIIVTGDFTMALSARMMFGGAWNLSGGTRSVTTTRAVTLTNAVIAGGNTTWGLGTVATVASSVSNGTLRVLRDPSAANPYVSFRLASNPTFYNNAGLALGSGVLATLGNSHLTNANPANLVALNLEAGAVFNLGETAVSRNATVASLSGDGLIANFNNTTTPGTYLATLTVNGGDSTGTTDFGGRLADTDTTLNPLSVFGTVAFTKSGASTQVFSGNNAYTGPTVVNGGELRINGDQAAARGEVTVTGAVLGGHGRVGGSVSITNGGVLAPGGAQPGRLTLATNLALAGDSRLLIELGGTNPPSLLQSGATHFDCVTIDGSGVLGGELVVTLVNGFIPSPTDSCAVLTAGGVLSGTFTNIQNQRVSVTNVPGASFQVMASASTVTLTNYQVLKAGFTASVTNGSAPLNVVFTDVSTGAITNRFWDFGDGSTTNILSGTVPHSFATPGAYLVSLVVSDGLAFSTNSMFIQVAAPPQPPVLKGISWSGSDVILSGANGVEGADYHVLKATNLTIPMTNWQVIATNQFEAGGVFHFTNPVTPGEPQNYYRVRLP